MKKYIAIINAAWQRQFTYRANIFAFRVGNILELSFMLLIWSAIFANNAVIGGYSKKEMMTYLVLTWLFTFITTTYGIEDYIGAHIRDGKLSEFVIKPISYLRYIAAMSIGRASMSTIYGVLFMVAFMFIFREYLIFPESTAAVLSIVLVLALGIMIRLLLAILVGLIAFWTNEVSGINYTLNTIIRFMAGTIAPLNLLPKNFFNILQWSPFVYITYYPAQIYLGKIEPIKGLTGAAIELLWLVVLYIIIRIVWSIGIRKYEAFGN